jgi:hypothetical protein
MNPQKWKSIVVSIESYKTICALAKSEDRTISGQLTHLLKNVTAPAPHNEQEEVR